uniref:Uncharacterized protein n=1 Tax=Anopheles atroparvus TaxID=41427 RepID=A0AAG5DN02_ANOAO
VEAKVPKGYLQCCSSLFNSRVLEHRVSRHIRCWLPPVEVLTIVDLDSSWQRKSESANATMNHRSWGAVQLALLFVVVIGTMVE